MKKYNAHYIRGQWVDAQSDNVFEVHDSSTEEVFATVPQGTRAEAEQAVLAAREAFDSWSQLPVETLCAYIDKIVEGLKSRSDEMALTIAREVGMPLKLAKMIQVGGPVFNWGNAAKVARRLSGKRRSATPWSCVSPWVWSVASHPGIFP